jgi:hypothetical protein
MLHSFEELRSPNQELSFKQINDYVYKKSGKRTISGLMTDDGFYNNYAYMISDQCPWHFIIRTDGYDMVFDGPLPVQLEQCYEHLRENSPFTTILHRVAKYRCYPSSAILETLVNATLHFDASRMSPIVIELERDLMNITSPGGLLPPQEWTDIVTTNPRNRRMADLMVSLKYASLKGRGLSMIKSGYHTSGLVPCFIRTEDEFSVRLPSLDMRSRTPENDANMVLSYLLEHRSATISELSMNTMLSIYAVKKMVAILEQQDCVFTMGIGVNRRVYLVNAPKVPKNIVM